MKPFFTAEDFHLINFDDLAKWCADQANAKLEREGRRVFKSSGYGHFDTWIEDEDELDAPALHTATLINIRTINENEEKR